MSEEKFPVEGKHLGRLIDYGVGKTRAGDPQVILYFEFNDGHATFRRAWLGSFKSGRAKQITDSVLSLFGFSANRYSTIANGIEGNVLNTKKQVELTIAYEQYEGKNGPATRWRILWVNPLGGQVMENKINEHDAAVLFGEVSPDQIKDDFAQGDEEVSF